MRHSHLLRTAAIIGLVTSLGGCASLQKQFVDFKLDMSRKDVAPVEMSAAILEIDESLVLNERPIEIEFIKPLVMPEFNRKAQMKLRPASYVTSGPVLKPFEAIEQANASASIEPNSSNYLNAIQVYPYTPGSLYQVYCAPQQVTDIALQPGEELTSVSAGDTIRWIVGDTVSGAIGGDQVHILVKPTKPSLATNLVITTSKRTYYLELHSYKDTYMAAVSWRYPREALGLRGVKKMTRRAKSKEASTISKPSLSIDNLNFRYEIKGDNPHWRPLRTFDDGHKVFIQFPARLDQGEAPPLFVMGRKGKSQLVNYRVKGSYYIVDRLFKTAELRLGEKDQDVVRIVRDTKS